jgi:sec-independent protein translocase protein TatA
VGIIEPGHLVLILLIALIVIGPGRIGDLGGQLGRGIREFRDATEGKIPSTATPALGAGRYCTSCGGALVADAKFCTACGTPTAGAA